MIMHIVGNRPQFIKLAPVSKELQRRGYRQVVIHTGQHYDENMSEVFFEELGILKPDQNLGIGSGTHAQMTGRAMIEIEKALEDHRPDCVILYGDTDSTLAGAIATVKMNVPIVHIEAGIRTGKLKNPEEANRIVTDHLSDMLFCSDAASVRNLRAEGIADHVYQVGDVMYDTFLQYRKSEGGTVLKKHGLKQDGYALMTWHRQENTHSRERMRQIIGFLKKTRRQIVCPMHPGTRAKLVEYDLMEELEELPDVLILPPVGYADMMELMVNAHIILTDSGGVSKESYFAGVKCILMVDLNLWPDLMKANWITKLDFDSEASIRDALLRMEEKRDGETAVLPDIYGRGDASERIADILERAYQL